MPATAADIKLRWPALNQIAASAEFDAALADAALQVDAPTWGTRYDLAVTHLAAHLLSVGHPEIHGPGMVGSGPIASESVGEVSVSYAVQPISREEGLRSTAPGREFLRLQALVGPLAMVV